MKLTDVYKSMAKELKGSRFSHGRNFPRAYAKNQVKHPDPYCLWYADLRKEFSYPEQKNKTTTVIRRHHVLDVLERLATGKPSRSKYAPFLEKRAVECLKKATTGRS